MILIVEDEAIARRALRTLLSASGFDTMAVGSGEEAMRLVDEGCIPDIALVDLNLPGMNGLELIDRLEHIHPGMRTMLVTAALPEYFHDMRSDHGEQPIEYLRKPIDVRSLMDALHRTSATPA